MRLRGPVTGHPGCPHPCTSDLCPLAPACSMWASLTPRCSTLARASHSCTPQWVCQMAAMPSTQSSTYAATRRPQSSLIVSTHACALPSVKQHPGVAHGQQADSRKVPVSVRHPLPARALSLPAAVAPTQIRTRTRGPVPRKDEAPVYGIQSNKNFITTNAVEVILSKPKKVPQEEFNWTKRPGFGSVPVYLKRNKARVQEEKEQFETYLRMRREPVRTQHICITVRLQGCAKHTLEHTAKSQNT